MARDWRKLALAALAAAALASTGAVSLHAQTSAKAAKGAAKAPEKAPKKAAADDEEEELKPKAAPKRKKVDAAEAQRAVEAAGKLLEAGKAEPAAQALNATLAGGNLPPAIMAKALFYRGMVHRQQQKPAQAISDLTSALWLKGGLSPADRSSALQQRTAAYQEAGLSESGAPLVAALPQVVEPPVRERPVQQPSTNWGAATTVTATNTPPTNTSTNSVISTGPPPAPVAQQTQPQSGQSGSGWNLFGGLFGGGSSAQTTPTSAAAKPAPEPKASSWASNTEVRGAPPPQSIETAAIVARREGRFRVQVAMVRSQDEAMAVAAKVKRDYAMALAAREPEIDQAVVGNMGSFYRVRVGPFATQNEGQAACAKLKGSGLDCLVVTQ
jgi:hypothetical protein